MGLGRGEGEGTGRIGERNDIIYIQLHEKNELSFTPIILETI